MTKKIIAVDLDGTLLNSDSQISDFTKKTIKKVVEKGHQVIITTGRPYRMSNRYFLSTVKHFSKSQIWSGK